MRHDEMQKQTDLALLTLKIAAGMVVGLYVLFSSVDMPFLPKGRGLTFLGNIGLAVLWASVCYGVLTLLFETIQWIVRHTTPWRWSVDRENWYAGKGPMPTAGISLFFPWLEFFDKAGVWFWTTWVLMIAHGVCAYKTTVELDAWYFLFWKCWPWVSVVPQ